ncbi:MAG TPA: hypothetical protein DCF62_03035, partial [Porticoccaceae bacterium]|nr:hypothetical protein [Porticoccaceae bacterium]
MKLVNALILVFSSLLLCPNGLASVSGLDFVESASGKKSTKTRELVQWTHSRLVFNKTLERVAVGQ